MKSGDIDKPNHKPGKKPVQVQIKQRCGGIQERKYTLKATNSQTIKGHFFHIQVKEKSPCLLQLRHTNRKILCWLHAEVDKCKQRGNHTEQSYS